MAGTIYPTSFSLINPTVDWLILVACSASVLAILALSFRRLGRARMVALMLPALLIALFSLSPVVLLSIGALGTIAGILYLILHSSELLRISPGKDVVLGPDPSGGLDGRRLLCLGGEVGPRCLRRRAASAGLDLVGQHARAETPESGVLVDARISSSALPVLAPQTVPRGLLGRPAGVLLEAFVALHAGRQQDDDWLESKRLPPSCW